MKELRFGVIGWGYWGPKIARNLDTLSNGMVTTVADMDVHRLASLSINQPWIQTTTHVEDVFHSDVDGVIVATPVRTHYRLAKEALLHGKHVLVEKPLTASVAEAEELVALAQEQQRILMVGHTLYDDTNPAEMIKIYNKGADIHADPVVSYRFGEITIPHIDWIEPLRLECEDFANAIATGVQPRAHGGVGLEVVRILARAQEALEKQEKQSVAVIS